MRRTANVPKLTIALFALSASLVVMAAGVLPEASASANQSLNSSATLSTGSGAGLVSHTVRTSRPTLDSISSSSAAGSALTWSAPTTVDTSSDVALLSCSSESFCMMIDGNDHFAVWKGDSWSAARSVGTSKNLFLTSISCTSSSFCMSVGGFFTVWNGKSWSIPASITSDNYDLKSVSCVSASFCVGVGVATGPYLQATAADAILSVAAIWNGATWSPLTWQPNSNNGETVSCTSRSFCMAGTQSDGAYVWNGTTWSSANDAGDTFASVSCTSPSFCLGADGESSVWNGASWSAFEDGYGNGPVSCPSSTECVDADQGAVSTWNGESWSTLNYIDSGLGLDDTSCPTTSFCAAVGTDGYAFTTHVTSRRPSKIKSKPHPKAPKKARPKTSSKSTTRTTTGHSKEVVGQTAWRVSNPFSGEGVKSLACPSVSECFAAGKTLVLNDSGNSSTGTIDMTTNGGKLWTGTLLPAGALYFSSISCPSTSDCYALGTSSVASNGVLIIATTDGGLVWKTVTPPSAANSASFQVTGDVVCSSDTQCYLLGDHEGYSTTDGGTTWSSETWFGVDNVLAEIACPTTSVCYGIGDGSGVISTRNGGATWTGRNLPTGTTGISDITCPSSNVCYVLGQNNLLATIDGGAKWTTLTTPSGGGSLESIACSSTTNCHVLAELDAFVTSNGGSSWTKQVLPYFTNDGMTPLTCPSASACYAAGSGVFLAGP